MRSLARMFATCAGETRIEFRRRVWAWNGFLLAGLCCMPAIAQWVVLEREDRPITISTTGTVESTDKLHFGPPSGRGWRMTIATLVAEGQKVEEGQVLVSFEGSSQDERIADLTSRLNVQKGELVARKEQQVNEIETEKLQLAEARSNAERAARKASQPAESIPAIEYRKLVEYKCRADSMLKQMEARLRLNQRVRKINIELLEVSIIRTEKLLEGAKREQASSTIRAPRSGVAVIGTDWSGNKFDVGDSVHPGLVVVYLVLDDKLGIEASVHEHSSSQVRVGQRVLVRGDAASGDELIGWIDRVDSSVRRESRDSLAMVRGVYIRLEKDNGHQLKLGSSVQVTIETEISKGSLAVPSEAISYRSGFPGVNLASGWHQVKLGEASGDLVIVLEGVEEGDRIRL